MSELRGEKHEIEVSVGDMERDDAAGIEMLGEDRECFAGEHVNGHGVGAEGVQDDEIEGLLGRGDAEAAVSDHDVDIRAPFACVGEKGEKVFVGRDRFDEGIDLEEGNTVAFFAVGGDSSCAESDDADLEMGLAGAEEAEDIAERTELGVIGVCDSVQFGSTELLSVERGAVHDFVTGDSLEDLVGSEERTAGKEKPAA